MKTTLLALFAVIMTVGSASGQDDKYGTTPDICKENLSVYRGYRDQKLYDDAFEPWKKALEVCPSASKKLYIDGVKFHKAKIRKEEDKAVKTALKNACLALYDQRIQYFGEEGKVKGRKAVDTYVFFPKDLETPYALFKEAIALTAEKTEGAVMSRYYQVAFKMLQAGKVEKADLLEEYLVLKEYIDVALVKYAAKERVKNSYIKAEKNITEIFVLVAECEDIVAIAKKKLADNPGDLKTNKKVLSILNKRGCDDNDIIKDVAKLVHAAEPSKESAYSLGIMELKGKSYSSALTYFEQAIELCVDCSDIETYYLRAGQVASIAGKGSTARKYGNKILAINPNSAEAIVLIGDAILSGVKSCDDGKLQSKACYWLAYDYYARAKGKGAAHAGKKMANCKAQFPGSSDVFFHGLKDGDKYTIGCWINEATTVKVN